MNTLTMFNPKKLPTNKPDVVKPASAPPALAETGRGMSFVVDFNEGPKSSKASRRREKVEARMASRTVEKKSDTKLVDYTDDEAMMIAEIMRDAHLEEKKQKAGNVDVKIFDASRRRMCTNNIKEQQSAKKDVSRSSTGDIAERRRRVKEMAEESRRRAALERPLAAV